MLVIWRKLEETIVLETPDGQLITVRVVDIGKRNVWLGITAPKEIEIVRGELWEGWQRGERQKHSQPVPRQLPDSGRGNGKAARHR